jgi:hypothetical protein
MMWFLLWCLVSYVAGGWAGGLNVFEQCLRSRTQGSNFYQSILNIPQVHRVNTEP